MDPVARVFQGFTAYQLSAALKGAIELDLFSAIAEGNATAEALATRCQASTRGVRILCDYLAAVGFLHKTDGRYTLDPESGPLLDRHSPLYVGSAIRFLASPVVMQSFADVAGAVRKGGTVVDAGGATAPEHPMWVDFARAMAPLAGFVAQLLANLLDADAGRPWHVLDIAAGHGLFGITLAARNPRASVVALDWANVLTVAEENARAAGVADRFRTVPGSAFTVDYGRDYDLVLLTNFLHHFDEEACVAVLRKVHAALRPGGRDRRDDSRRESGDAARSRHLRARHARGHPRRRRLSVLGIRAHVPPCRLRAERAPSAAAGLPPRRDLLPGLIDRGDSTRAGGAESRAVPRARPARRRGPPP